MRLVAPRTPLLLVLLAGVAACARPATVGQTDAWVDRTLATLTLEQKVGQLIMPWIGGDYLATDSPEFERIAQWVERDGVGGFVISVGLPHSYAAKLNELQRRARVPLLVTSDMEFSPGMRLAGIYSFPHLLPQGGGTNFPPAMAMGAVGSDSLAREVGRVLAREARAVGVHMTFGPVLDVNSNPKNPIINTRSFGEDPSLVARLAAAFSRGAREAGLLTTGKHFPGHGDTDVDSHLDLPAIQGDRARLDSIELAPFRALVRDDDLDAVMTAHIAVVGVEGADAPPATLSPAIINGVLRRDLHFSGLVFTDAMDMGAIVKRYGRGEPLLRALEAGSDVLLMPRNVDSAIATVTEAVRSGRISMARLDSSVRRVLNAKARANVHRSRIVSLEEIDNVVGRRAHTELAAHVAERSITLARDAGGLVPFARDSGRVLVLVHAAPNDPISGRVFVNALRGAGHAVQMLRVDARATPEDTQRARELAGSVDLIVAATFVMPVEGEGSVGTRGPYAALVQELAESKRPLVAVSFGSPYLLDAFPGVSSYLLAWSNADVSQVAAARALTGRASITGTLPVSLPPHHQRGEGLRREGGR